MRLPSTNIRRFCSSRMERRGLLARAQRISCGRLRRHPSAGRQPLSPFRIQVIKLQGGATFDTVTWRGAGTHYELSVEQGKIHSTQAGGAIY